MWNQEVNPDVLLHLSMLAAHNNLQHRVVVGPGIDLRQVEQVGGHGAQTALDDSPLMNQVLKDLRRTEGVRAEETTWEINCPNAPVWVLTRALPFSHLSVSFFGSQL